MCVWGVISYQGNFTLHSVSSVDRISYREGKKKSKSKGTPPPPCLIHWAATVSVQQGGKDNFSQGRLPGTTLDHRLPSSLFSLTFMNKMQAPVSPVAEERLCFIRCNVGQNVDFWLWRGYGLSPRPLKGSLYKFSLAADVVSCLERVVVVVVVLTCRELQPSLSLQFTFLMFSVSHNYNYI